jgi:hypothetical protein
MRLAVFSIACCGLALATALPPDCEGSKSGDAPEAAAVNGERQASQSGPARDAPPGPTGSGVFPQECRDRGVPGEVQGYFKSLEITVDMVGDFSEGHWLAGELRKEDRLIADSPRVDSARPAAARVASKADSRQATLLFSGEAIRASGLDGPYAVELTLLGAKGEVIRTGICHTTAWRHEAFAESPAQILSVTESESPAAHPAAGGLVVQVKFDLLQPQTLVIDAVLSRHGEVIASAGSKTQRPAGVQTAELTFSGNDIRAAGVDGPYDLAVFLLDESATQICSFELHTRNYKYVQFGNRS